MAVKVTEVPAQIKLSTSEDVIVTLTGKVEFTVSVTVLDVAVVEVRQVPPVMVITQLT